MSDNQAPDISWRERVAAARARGAFTKEEIRLACHEWMTCAVGEQHKLHPELGILVIPRGWTALTPATPVLRGLGSEGYADDDGFVNAVMENDFDMAERVLDRLDDLILTYKRQGGAGTVKKRQRKKG